MEKNNPRDQDSRGHLLGARNLRGEESEQSKERRRKAGKLTDEETVDLLRKRKGRA